MSLRKEVKVFYGDVEVANAEKLSHLVDVSGAQMRRWLKDSRFADNRPSPLSLDGDAKSAYYELSKALAWLAPLVTETRKRQLNGVGRPRSLRTPVTKQL
jgi:hypothetical protein